MGCCFLMDSNNIRTGFRKGIDIVFQVVQSSNEHPMVVFVTGRIAETIFGPKVMLGTN